MKIDYKEELKVWMIYFLTILTATYIHEIAHCIPAWIKGYQPVPTLAKGYFPFTVSAELQKYISLGGIIGTISFSFIALILYPFNQNRFSTAMLAGAIAAPGFYTLRFIFAGRGHDATEFQEAQSALGLSYSGNSLDFIFLLIFSAGVISWIIKTRPGLNVTGRLLIGFAGTLIFIAGLQTINNAIFDPIFQK